MIVAVVFRQFIFTGVTCSQIWGPGYDKMAGVEKSSCHWWDSAQKQMYSHTGRHRYNI